MTGYSSSIRNLESSHQFKALRHKENISFLVSDGQTNFHIQNTVQILFNIIKIMTIPLFNKENDLFTEHQGWLQYSNVSHAKKLLIHTHTQSEKSGIYYGQRKSCPLVYKVFQGYFGTHTIRKFFHKRTKLCDISSFILYIHTYALSQL